eukprot:TRINITY_DN1308_c0_g1_i4.p1 TRINITY_DN1308_c0_g1~~TRINITY_DN1308_c0_g1_i4.p1  ORF type:complete len:1098 (+),score=327.22 TRINITY_DN1308_c0_g1_i4:172-3465(+)
MSNFPKPENALKRAEELIVVGQKSLAHQTLHDIITGKRYKTWSPVLNDIMLKYIELSVEMRKSKQVKDALYQYKGTTQNVNVGSLETVIRHFISLSERAAADAQSRAKQIQVDAIEDLDEEEAPESLILSAVTGEDNQARAERESVTPWLRFLWETYRAILDTLRNHSKSEHVYHETAQMAFAFCKKYQRKTEFKRLCDILRTHLSQLSKQQGQTSTGPHHNVSLSSPQTIEIHLETRFAQLNVAIDLDLWQEAFKSVEDIHQLLTLLSGRGSRPQHWATYYEKLARVFWVSNNYLYHAHALYKFYTVSRTYNKGLSQEDIQMLSTRIMIAALSVPPTDSTKSRNDQILEVDSQRDKMQRMAQLLGFPGVVPTREQLIQELVIKKVHTVVFPAIRELHIELEKRFQPLTLAEKVKPVLEFVAKTAEAAPASTDSASASNPLSGATLRQYLPALERVAFLRVLQQLSQVYDTIRLTEFARLVNFISTGTWETLLIEVVRRKNMGLRVDHQQGALHFNSISLDSDNIRERLTQLGKNLSEADRMIHATPSSIAEAQKEAEAKAKVKKDLFVKIVNALGDEHRRILARKIIIEKWKEYYENLERAQAEVAQTELRRINEAKQAAEAKRLEEDRVRREDERKKKAEEERIRAEVVRTAQGLGMSLDNSLLSKPDIDAQTVVREHISQLQKARNEMEKKINMQGKRLYHLERARRQEEFKVLSQLRSKTNEEARKHHEEQMVQFMEDHKKQHAVALEDKARLTRMEPDIKAFMAKVQARRDAEYKKHKAEMDRRAAERKAHQEEEAARRREEEERLQAEAERARRDREQGEANRRQEEEDKKRGEEERRKKLDDSAAMQRKREAEIEQRSREREREERETRPPAGDGWRRPGAGAPSGEDEWRRREEDRRPPAPSGGGWRDKAAASASARGGEPAREDAPRGSWRDREEVRGRDEPPRGRDDGPRGGFGRDEPPRGGGGWRDRGSDDGPRGGRDDGPRGGFGRDDGPRDGPRGGFGRDDGPRGGIGRDDGPRGGFGRDEPPRGRDEGPRDEPPRGGWRDRQPEEQRGAASGGWRDKARATAEGRGGGEVDKDGFSTVGRRRG